VKEALISEIIKDLRLRDFAGNASVECASSDFRTIIVASLSSDKRRQECGKPELVPYIL
jgi:hypothetical protein